MPRDEMHAVKETIRRAGQALGLARVGFAPVRPLPRRVFLESWIRGGYAAGMDFIARTAEVRHLPTHLLPKARTAIVAAASYAAEGPRFTTPVEGYGAVARYARGRDYHHVLRERLEHLARELQRIAGPVQYRVAVDTSPLLERELALAAGLGFIGKNTLLITPGLGSYTVLGTLLVELELPPDDAPDPVRRCGRCRLCVDACPTGALVEPFLLDARRCISYLTVEHRGPVELGPSPGDPLGPWVFGCDACQEVCPYNARAGRRAPPDGELAPQGVAAGYPLLDLLELRAGAYRRLVHGRALSRASRLTLKRNAALVSGGQLRAGLRLDDRVYGALDRLGAHPDEGLSRAVRWALDAWPPRAGVP